MKDSLNKILGIILIPFVLFVLFLLNINIARAQIVTGFSGSAGFEENVLFWDKFTASTPLGYEIYWQNTPGVSLLSNVVYSNGLNISFVHSNLNAGATYYYAIRVIMSNQQYSVLSNEIAITPLPQNNLFAGSSNDGYSADLTCNSDLNGNIISVSPSGLAVAPAPGSNYVYWNFLSGATSYTLEWATDPNFINGVGLQSNITDISFVHNNVVPGTTYYYHVQAVMPGGCPASYSSYVAATAVTQANNAGGGEGDGHSANSTCNIDLDGNSILLAPGNFSVATSQASSVLYWSPLSGAQYYIVEIDSTGGSFIAPRVVSNITDVSWVHYKAVESISYYYRVTAYVSGSCPADYSQIISTIPVLQSYLIGGSNDGYANYMGCMIDLDGNNTPPAPANLMVAASHGKNVLFWQPLAGISSYTIRYSTDQNFNVYNDITGITDISYVHNNLPPNVTYYYMVTATLIGGCPSGFTNPTSAVAVNENYVIGNSGDGYSNDLSCSILLNGVSAAPAPAGLNVASSHGSNVLFWEQLAGALSYTVRWSNDPTFISFNDITGITNLSYVHSGLIPGLTYYYKITADLPSGCPAGITNSFSAVPSAETYLIGTSGDGYQAFKTCMSDLNGNSIVVSPTGFNLAASHNSTVLFWNYVVDAISYTVRWSNSPNFSVYSDISNITDVSFVHNQLVAGVPYYYMVAPVFSGNCLAGFSNPLSVSPVSSAYIVGSVGDGYAMSASCFTMTLDGFDPVVSPPGPHYACGVSGPVVLSSSPAVSYQWYHDGNLLQNETNQDITVNLPGYYVVEITNINNCYAWSFPVVLLSSGSVVFNVNPHDTFACVGDNAAFIASVIGATSYQWQVSYDGGNNWVNVVDNVVYSGSSTNILYISDVDNSMNNYLYQCIATSGCVGISTPASLFVANHPSFSSQPTDALVCSGDAVYFGVVANGFNISYQWYENQGSGWNLLSNSGVYSGVNADTLIISNSLGMQGYQYYCSINACSVDVASDTAILLHYNPISIITNPSDVYECDGASASFFVVATGSTPSYQWYENQGSGWIMLNDNSMYSGTNSSVLNISDISNLNGFQYQCVVNECNLSLSSSSATLFIHAAPVINAGPSDVILCSGPASLSIAVTGTALTYQWFVNSGSGWATVANGGIYSGADTAVLYISDISGLNSYQYYCVVTTCAFNVISSSASITESSTNVWLGYSTNWDVSSNWLCGIPDQFSNVTIPSNPIGGNLPLVLSNNISVCKDIIIDTTAGVNISSAADLSVFGNWINHGNNDIGDGKIIFNGSSQNIDGNTTFGHITINNNSSVNILSGTQNVKGILLCNGNLYTNNNLTLLSTSSGTALISGAGVGNVFGVLTQQRFVPAVKALGYKHFSSAFYDVTVGQFANFMTLELGSTLNSPFPTLFKFSEADANPSFGYGWVQAAPQGQFNVPIDIAEGYTAQFGSGIGQDVTAYLFGNVNNANVQVDVTLDNPGSGKGDGWNLIGNPYPSPIDLDKLPYSASNLNKSVSIFISTSLYNGYYGYYNSVIHISLNGGTRYLGSLNAFFVQCNNTAGGTLNFNNNVRSDIVNPLLYKNEFNHEFPYVKLSAFNNKYPELADETAICFIESASDIFDSEFDASKIFNTDNKVPNLYSYYSNNNLAINALSQDFNNDVVVPIAFSSKIAGENFIKAIDISNFDNDMQIYLEDVVQNRCHDLKNDNVYSFNFNTNEPEKGRFFLRFSKKSSYFNDDFNNDYTFYNAYSFENEIFISYNDVLNRVGVLELFDINGKLIVNTEILNNGLFKYKYNLPSGNYLLRFSNENYSKVSKIFLKK